MPQGAPAAFLQSQVHCCLLAAVISNPTQICFCISMHLSLHPWDVQL